MSYVVENGATRVFGGSHRKPSSDVTRLQDAHMSGQHFRISNLGGSIVLADCQSRNGTWINGQKITEKNVEEGTVFQAGRTRLQVRWEKRPDDIDTTASPLLVEATQGSSLMPHLDSFPSESVSNGYHSPIESSVIDSQPSSFSDLEKTDGNAGFSPVSPVAQERSLPSPLRPTEQEEEFDASPTPFPGSDPFEVLNAGFPNFDPVVRLVMPIASRWTDFHRVMQDLGKQHDFYAVVHLAKLADYSKESRLGIPLFPHLDPTGSVLPVAIAKSEWMFRLHGELAERLLAVDGLLLVVCESNADDIHDSLQSLGRVGVPGFSERGGFVPWCWPSGAHGVLESISDAMIGRWFGTSIQALVFPCGDRILAYTRREKVESFSRVGFS